jgi:predicted dehydrogenase|tara:strand:- start:12 stop:1139 length:1128 start_codon:yes stop_codon:yes gene_type:complete
MDDSILKVGIAGCGVVGNKRRNCVDQHPNMKTVAVCDIRFREDATMVAGAISNYDYSSLEKRNLDTFHDSILQDGVHYYNNYKELLKNQSMDVLIVCLPNYLASEVTIAGLESGLHVFCEKPPARTVEEVKKVIKCSKKYPHLKLKYGFNHRYHKSVKKAKAIIDSAEYGEVINLRGIYGKSRIIPFSGGWRSQRKYAGGGILLDQGIHMLDMIRYFSGDFDEIKSFVSNNYWKHDVEDNAFAIMRNEKGCIASLHSTSTQWQHRFRLEITLRDALIELSGILSGSKSYGEEKLKIIPRKDESITGSQDIIVYSFLDDYSWKEEVNEFVDCILNDKPIENGTSYEALKIMEMIFSIYKSDKAWWGYFNKNNEENK